MKKDKSMPKVKTGGSSTKTDLSEVVRTLREGNNSVYYEKSITKNLGNYESAKITVGVTLPVQPTEDEVGLVKSTLEVADKIVTEELVVQLRELNKDDKEA